MVPRIDEFGCDITPGAFLDRFWISFGQFWVCYARKFHQNCENLPEIEKIQIKKVPDANDSLESQFLEDFVEKWRKIIGTANRGEPGSPRFRSSVFESFKIIIRPIPMKNPPPPCWKSANNKGGFFIIWPPNPQNFSPAAGQKPHFWTFWNILRKQNFWFFFMPAGAYAL